MTGPLVRKLSGHVRGRTGRTTPPLKGVSVRCPVSAGKNKSQRQRARDQRLEQVREARAALAVMLNTGTVVLGSELVVKPTQR
jgi:hypothetical protein